MQRTRTAGLFAVLCCAFSALSQPNVLGRAFPLTNARYGQRSGPLPAAANQKLELMTSSEDGVFVVWSEVRDFAKTYHAGVRSPLGDWKEIQLSDGAPPIAAAAGGGQFMIVVPRGEMLQYGWFFELGVQRWTAGLEAIGSEIPIHALGAADGFASIVAGWVGSAFVIAGISSVDNGDLAAMLLSPSGTLSAPKLIYDHHAAQILPYSFANASLAVHGNTFVVVWRAQQWGGCLPESCDQLFNYRTRALRVSTDLSSAEPMELAPYARNVESIGGVAWDGSAFVAAWKDRTSLYTRRIPPAGPIEPEVSVLSNMTAQELSGVSLANGGAVAAVPDGVVMLWKQKDEPRQSIIRSGAATPATTAFEHAPQQIASIGSAIAYASTAAQDGIPHYGATRVLMNIGDITLPEVPDAPRLSAALALDGHAVLTWTAPRQEATGYRIEQRGSNGEWLELEQWLSSANARLASIPVNGPASFRIRAWNDAGVSGYSNVVTPAPPFRRSIRH